MRMCTCVPEETKGGCLVPFDMGFPSVCYEYVLLPLVIKEAISASVLVKPSGIFKRRYGEKVGGVREMPCSC